MAARIPFSPISAAEASPWAELIPRTKRDIHFSIAHAARGQEYTDPLHAASRNLNLVKKTPSHLRSPPSIP
jgi:hypothetical protein